MRRILKLKGHKVTKEIAHQLMWALENDLMDYAANKNVNVGTISNDSVFFICNIRRNGG